MATTTNFGWETPDDTDLVKDGAAAIRTALGGVDTSFVDLKGGTTGQVLSKASDTDLDYTWVTTDDANAIQNAIVDAKGDLIVATAADTPARLAVGTNGQILTADSTASTGVKWASPAGGGKVLQVVSATYSTETQSNSSTYANTGLTATITPSSTSSKVLVFISQTGVAKSANTNFDLKLVRNSTDIAQISRLMLRTDSTLLQSGDANMAYLDSPATTSATTYKTMFASSANIAYTRVQNESTLSSIVLMEIGA